MTAELLREEAGYGILPFDCFALVSHYLPSWLHVNTTPTTPTDLA